MRPHSHQTSPETFAKRDGILQPGPTGSFKKHRNTGRFPKASDRGIGIGKENTAAAERVSDVSSTRAGSLGNSVQEEPTQEHGAFGRRDSETRHGRMKQLTAPGSKYTNDMYL
ncbi:hypothetical protein EYF80_054973 [Liparis tanakae]|uniref:Uncharacterized protein n=1 Tax=Liparis tanakae TaxID=230148 RepID=A0A4Z2F0Y5_9TELE|nr:hypothetical protein EYF80_054973 [Liparis tanakae]